MGNSPFSRRRLCNLVSGRTAYTGCVEPSWLNVITVRPVQDGPNTSSQTLHGASRMLEARASSEGFKVIDCKTSE